MMLPFPIDLLVEHGSAAMAPVLVGLGVLSFQTLIFLRDLDRRWSSASLALTPIPLLLGFAVFATAMRDAAFVLARGKETDNHLGFFLAKLEENLPALMISAAVTVILLGGAICLYPPVRRERPGSNGIIWGISVLMILPGLYAGGLIQQSLRMGMYFSGGLAGIEFAGIITELHRFLTGHIASWLVPIWLIIAAVASCWMNPRNRLRTACVVFGFAMLLSVTSFLLIVKAMVINGSSHPAVSGRAWVDVLKVRSW